MRRVRVALTFAWAMLVGLACSSLVPPSAPTSETASECDARPATDCTQLGLELVRGNDEREGPRARALLIRGCERGDPMGCAYLATVYVEGLGVTADPVEAMAWLERGCALGDQQSCANFAHTLLTSEPPDYDRARALFEDGCEAAHPFACASLGSLYEDGLGVAPDLERAQQLYARGCELGNAKACNNLAVIHIGDDPDDPDQIAAALPLIIRACELGEGEVCNTLGLFYALGRGVPVDEEEAMRWFERGCKLEFPQACSRVGLGLLTGSGGVSRNPERAVGYFERNCADREPLACLLLARCLLDGEGIEQDLERANELLDLVCTLDHGEYCDEAQRLR